MVYSGRQANGISGLYQSLVQHKIHQDQLLWSRIQILHALQAAVLAGGFALHYTWEASNFGGVLLLCGGVLTLVLFFLVLGDWADMKVNEGIMEELARRLLPVGMKNKVIRWTDRDVWHRKRRCVEGHYMIYGALILFMMVDFVVGLCLLIKPSMFG